MNKWTNKLNRHFMYFFFNVVPGIKLSASHVLGKHPATKATIPVPVCFFKMKKDLIPYRLNGNKPK